MEIGQVRSGSGALKAYSNDMEKPAALNRRGELIGSPGWAQQMAAEGRVFQVANSARQTALAVGGTSFSDTAPAFVLDVPVGYTIIPVRVILHQGGTVAGGVITVLITTDRIARYSSSGTSFTPVNLRDDGPRTSACSFYSGATLAAVNTEILLYGAIVDVDVATAPHATATRIEWPQDPGYDVTPIMVGPASLVVYTFASATQPSWFFNFTWVEMDTSNVY